MLIKSELAGDHLMIAKYDDELVDAFVKALSNSFSPLLAEYLNYCEKSEND